MDGGIALRSRSGAAGRLSPGGNSGDESTAMLFPSTRARAQFYELAFYCITTSAITNTFRRYLHVQLYYGIYIQRSFLLLFCFFSSRKKIHTSDGVRRCFILTRCCVRGDAGIDTGEFRRVIVDSPNRRYRTSRFYSRISVGQ